MANVGKMNIQAGFDGKPAERGFAGLSKSLTGLSDQMRKMGTSFLSGNFLTEINSGISLIQGLANKVIAFVDAGAKLETTQIQFGYLFGDFQKGSAALENLRDVAAETGVPLESAVKSFRNLSLSGLSAATSLDLVRQSMQFSELLGGAQGVEAFGQAMAQLGGQSSATEQILGQMQSSGLRVFETLAQSLAQLTGRAFTVRDAIEELRRGTVLSATAIQAIQGAANAPEAVAARGRFEASFEGQLNRLKGTAQAFMTDISKMILTNLPLNEIFAGLRGLLSGMRDIVSVVIADVGKVFDPAGRLGNIKTAFDQGKKIIIDIVEVLVTGGLKFAKLLLSGAQAIIDAVKGIINLFALPNVKNLLQYNLGATNSRLFDLGLISRKELNRRMNAQLAELQPEKEIWKGFQLPNLDATLADMDAFFAKARARVEGPQAGMIPGQGNAAALAAFNKANPLLANAAFWNTWDDWTKGLKENGFVISTNNEQVRGLIDSFKAGRIGFVEFEKGMLDLNTRVETTKRTIDELSRETLNSLATPLETFNKGLEAITIQSQQLQKAIDAGVVDPADRAKAAQALARKAGKQLQDFLAQNQVGDSFIAGRSEFGTAGAIETVLRNRLGDRGLDIQERIAQGIARQEIIQKEQKRLAEKMIDAIMRVKPGTFILQGK